MKPRLLHFVILACCLSHGALAQVRPVTVRIRVTDSTRAPLENVTVGVMAGLNVSLAAGTTDPTGIRVLRIDSRPDEIEVVARRVGFAPASKLVPLERRDTITVELTLRRLTQQLEAVRVTAEQTLKRQRLTVDADAIAAYDRPLIDATDIVNKMRPDMIFGLGGREACRPAQFVWVNGVRVEDPPVNAIMDAKHSAGTQFVNTSVKVDRSTSVAPPAKQSAAQGPTSLRGGPHTAYAALPLDVLSILASIKPEHIASMEMHDCKDVSIDKKGGSAAIFVILKDGVTFEPGIGSRVGSSRAADSLIRRITLKPPPAAAAIPQEIERYRMRILGLFDEASGAPVDSAEIVDASTGQFTRTTETGTAALAFLAPGVNHIVIRKPGFRTDTLTVRISPADTLPITVLLSPLPH